MTNLEAALKYLSKGWPVFPINPASKKPCLESWKDYQNRIPSVDEIEAWWTKWPWANIGLVAGELSGVSVIDVDPRHRGTTNNLLETVKAKTGGGGWHYFYKYNPGVYSRNGLAEGIDLKSDGGYVILPPSEHKSGNKYKWVTPPFVNEFKPLPQWVIDSQKNKGVSTFDPALLQGVSEGQRNESAASVIGKILHGLKEEDWQTIGWQIAEGWNSKNNPPLSKQELLNVFKSIAKAQAQKGYKQSSLYTPTIEINRVFEPILAKDMKTQLNIEINWVCEGLMAKNYLTLLAAREKMGKTSLLKGLLKALVEGGDFLSQKVIKSKVLVITEEGEGLWNRRLDDLGLSDCDSLWFEPQPFNTRLKQKEWEQYLIEDVAPFCEKNQVEVLILDTISPIWPVLNENDASQTQTALLPLVAIARKGVAVLPVHHYSKAGGIRGSTVLGAVPDILLDFSKPRGDEDTSRRLLKCRSRFEESPAQLLLDYKDGEYILLGSPQNVARQEKLDQVKKVLAEYPNGATVQELLDGWGAEGKKPSRSMLKIYLNDLCFTQSAYQMGEKEIKGGKAFIYSLSPNNDGNYQGTTILDKNEANNPSNHDMRINTLPRSNEVEEPEKRKGGGKYDWL